MDVLGSENSQWVETEDAGLSQNTVFNSERRVQ